MLILKHKYSYLKPNVVHISTLTIKYPKTYIYGQMIAEILSV